MKYLKKINNRFPVLIYFIFYLLIIFGFATWYWELPDKNFYHFTSKYEYNKLNMDVELILNDLEKSIISSNLKTYGDSVINHNDWLIDLKKINVKSINVKEYPNYIDLNMTFFLEKNSLLVNQTAQIKVNLQKRIQINNHFLYFISSDYKPITIDTLRTPDINILFNSPLIEKSQTSYLTVNNELRKDIHSFAQGYRGFPDKEVSGHFARMLYVSTGVATATLTGDIVPLTDKARFLFTLEGFLCLIVIGFLINHLFSSIKSRKSHKL